MSETICSSKAARRQVHHIIMHLGVATRTLACLEHGHGFSGTATVIPKTGPSLSKAYAIIIIIL